MFRICADRKVRGMVPFGGLPRLLSCRRDTVDAPSLEATMDDIKRSSREIAEEAVGERLGSPPPDEAKKRAARSPEEAVRQIAMSAGSQASRATRTAESIGERVEDAYADGVGQSSARLTSTTVARLASQATDGISNMLAAGGRVTQTVSRQFAEQPLMPVVVGFVLGYVTGLAVRGRR
jgi:hypothetical protein